MITNGKWVLIPTIKGNLLLKEHIFLRGRQFFISRHDMMPGYYPRESQFERQNYRDLEERDKIETKKEYDDDEFVRDQRGRQNYLDSLHPDSLQESEYDLLHETDKVPVRNRNTQTPVRSYISEGIQYEETDAQKAKSTFKPSQKHQKADSKDLTEEEKIPFSSIKKYQIILIFRREVTDSDSDRKILDQSPLRNLDTDEIIEMIKTNEKLQKEIINDPALRDKLMERFSTMKHSSSDPNFPHSFWSSKYAERRTQGNTDVFRTPLRSDEGTIKCNHLENKDTSHRFTQFANSEMSMLSSYI